jgi:hypothetical protein
VRSSLIERLKREGPVKVCYEAGVSGYDLYHQITRLGASCQVIAPALTPRRLESLRGWRWSVTFGGAAVRARKEALVFGSGEGARRHR